MRVSLKLSIALCCASVLVIGSHGLYQLRQESADLRASISRELRLTGTAVQVAVENAARDGQPADIRETLEALERIDPVYDVFVFGKEQQLAAHSGDQRLDLAMLRSVTESAFAVGHPLLRFVGENLSGYAIFAAPLRDESQALLGTVALVRPLDDAERDLMRTGFAIAASVLVLVVALAGLCYGIGAYYVGRPLALLLQAVRLLRSGQAPPRVTPTRQDEVGTVTQEFNELVQTLADTRAQLASEVEARHTLEAGLQRLDKLATIGQLAAGLAHEIGSPLQILNGRARVLKDRATDSETRRYADIFVEQTDRITRIVAQLARVARRVPPRFQRMDIRQVLREVVELLELSTRRKGLTIGLDSATPLPAILADPAQVQQVALNLLNNAMASTESGGFIQIDLKPTTKDTAGELTQAVRITVSDSGRGIDAETLPQIFEPFFTTRSERGGTGLGLAVVRSLVQAHGGEVWAESTPGEGSRFYVILPVNGPPQSAEVTT
jgi:signal transduction histidine kinase